MDVVWLARVQFALAVMFHYIFPPLTIGVGLLMVIMEGTYMRTRNPIYEAMAKFWTKVFAVNFAMGVSTGIVMTFQFGMNWGAFSNYVGNIFGAALAAEGIFAFFLESGFLAVLLFGWDRVSPPVHFFATIMTTCGAIFSAVWIIIANSWMQTPAGYQVVEFQGVPRAELTFFWDMIFNPSTVPRLIHTLIGCFIVGAFFVMSISAYYIVRNRFVDFAKRSFTIALLAALVYSFVMMSSGDLMARTVAFYQPEKLATFEGHFKTGEGPTPFLLFGVPDEKEQTVKYALYVPKLLTFLVYRNFTTPVKGRDYVKDPADRPPLWIPFLCYHIMIYSAGLFAGLTLLGAIFLWRGTLFEKKWLMWIFVFAIIFPYMANHSGWICAEVGRQPWVVYHQMKTSHGVSAAVSGGEVLAGIIMFAVIYGLLFFVWIYVLSSKILHGPELPETPPETTTVKGLLGAAAERMRPELSEMADQEDESKESPS
ncbi:Cytochrome bd-I ubiquinol oxidase subunit 1 [Planctomycetes bacterium Pan216]|uniref:Cytochrome bd-I ubiquinol oxidase subunit 1 n=1 Tax=Kolteria novifilia TaxID=2527975 RepID=A0A518AZA7_9BACT|nr:Cytochrome bd-I ubiquinol oxidase subunit 1 [Planctomycetes bacterium Pan216]